MKLSVQLFVKSTQACCRIAAWQVQTEHSEETKYTIAQSPLTEWKLFLLSKCFLLPGTDRTQNESDNTILHPITSALFMSLIHLFIAYNDELTATDYGARKLPPR